MHFDIASTDYDFRSQSCGPAPEKYSSVIQRVGREMPFPLVLSKWNAENGFNQPQAERGEFTRGGSIGQLAAAAFNNGTADALQPRTRRQASDPN
jgi:hypothetical protein